MPFSISLVLILMGVVVLCRFISTIGLVSCLKLCRYESKHHNPLNYKELVFIWYSGLIRGAIAFGLVLRIEDSFAGRDLIVTTCLSLVVITTIIFGSTVSLVSYCLFGDVHKKAKKEGKEISTNLVEDAQDVTDDALGSSSDSSSERSGFQGPNARPMSESAISSGMLGGSDNFNRANTGGSYEASGSRRKSEKKRKTCGSYLKRFDEMCLKPIFIRKYNPEKAHLAEDFVYDYIEQGEKTEKQFI